MIAEITVEQINQCLIAEDIEGFIELGAPIDEYESEAEVIAQALVDLPQDERTNENIAAIISLVWSKYFNVHDEELALRMPGIQRVAKQLVAVQK